MKLFPIVVLAAFSSLRGFASSFGLASENDFARKRDRSSIMASSSTAGDVNTCSEDYIESNEEMHHNGGKKKNNKSTLVKFLASNTKCTPPLPMPPPTRNLDTFFGKKDYINLLFSADATLSEVDNPSTELWEMLHHCASLYQNYPGMKKPDTTTPIRFIELANPPMSFIGITLHSTASVGIQFLSGSEYSQQSKHSGFPELHFYLLSTNLEARGPAPLVWLFYKLIGKKQGEDGITSSTASRFQTSGFTRVWAEAKEKRKVVFHDMALLESRLRIPSILLKLVPFSIEHLEKQGSDSLQTAVDKDVVPALDRFQSAYMEWLSNSNV